MLPSSVCHQESECGVAFALTISYNPSLQSQTTTLKLDLYYTGETSTVLVREQENKDTQVTLARDYSVTVQVTLAPRATSYFVISRAGK